MDIHFDWQACDSSSKICMSPGNESILFFECKKKLRVYDFQVFHANSQQVMVICQSFFTYRSISAQVFSAKLRPPPNMVRACNCNRRERVRNMSTTATSSVGPVLYSSRTLSHPTPHPLLTIREHVQHVNNGNKFRGPCVILDHKRACATC